MSCRSEERSILRLWPKAAAVTRSRALTSQCGRGVALRHELDERRIDLGARGERLGRKGEEDTRGVRHWQSTASRP